MTRQADFIVWQPSAFTGESALVASAPLEVWKDWLAYHLIEDFSGTLAKGGFSGAYAGALPKAFSEEQFAFFGKTLAGITAAHSSLEAGCGPGKRYFGR